MGQIVGPGSLMTRALAPLLLVAAPRRPIYPARVPNLMRLRSHTYMPLAKFSVRIQTSRFDLLGAYLRPLCQLCPAHLSIVPRLPRQSGGRAQVSTWLPMLFPLQRPPSSWTPCVKLCLYSIYRPLYTPNPGFRTFGKRVGEIQCLLHRLSTPNQRPPKPLRHKRIHPRVLSRPEKPLHPHQPRAQSIPQEITSAVLTRTHIPVLAPRL